jgi:hypothetical protein
MKKPKGKSARAQPARKPKATFTFLWEGDYAPIYNALPPCPKAEAAWQRLIARARERIRRREQAARGDVQPEPTESETVEPVKPPEAPAKRRRRRKPSDGQS